MSIQRYGVAETGVISASDAGDYVSFEDHQRIVEALMAENARLIDIARGGAWVMKKALMKYEFGFGMTIQAEEFIRDASELEPATDAVIADIEARGVEKFVNRLQQFLDEGDFAGDEVGVIAGAIYCGRDMANQLRNTEARSNGE